MNTWHPMAVPDAWRIDLPSFGDERGEFVEMFKAEDMTNAVGERLELAQANFSVSRAGVLRGVHFFRTPPGQAKYVMCVSGAVLDVVVDLRDGSPTFGASDSVRLGPENRQAVYLSEGLGHGFQALTDHATVVYLCAHPYVPGYELGINPLDPALDLPWPAQVARISERDSAAPTLEEARRAGILPRYVDCRRPRVPAGG
jgi:dTDP-4-dehydrorhamnose 3,5-epimerase